MGSKECPGCHFGQGLVVDLQGELFFNIFPTLPPFGKLMGPSRAGLQPRAAELPASGRTAPLGKAKVGGSEGVAVHQPASEAAHGTIPGRSTPAASGSGGTGPVAELEVGPYGPLARRSVGDGLTPDHIPSFAAIRADVERQLGRQLTAAEARALRNQTNTIVIPTESHKQVSRTYAGRNTFQQIQADSQNLQRAFHLDRQALRQHLIDRGHSPQAVDGAFRLLDFLNREAGRY
jgi:hypothetical protein